VRDVDALTVLVIAEAVVIALLGLLVAGLLRSHADILRRLHELDGDSSHDHGGNEPGFQIHPSMPGPADSGTDVHDITGSTPAGDAIGIRVHGAPGLTLLAFLSTGCTTCAGIWEDLAARGALTSVGPARLVIITKGADEESPSLVGEVAPVDVPVVMSSRAWGDYGVPGSPYFVLADGTTNRTVGEGTATTWDQLAELIRQAVADRRLGSGFGRSARDADRADRIDRELAAAGIEPGDPSLYTHPEDGTPAAAARRELDSP
jgi:hypothetical protein